MKIIGKIFAHRLLSHTKLSTDKEDYIVFAKKQDVRFCDGMLYLRCACRTSQWEGGYDSVDGGIFVIPLQRISNADDGFCILAGEITEIFSEEIWESIVDLPFLENRCVFIRDLPLEGVEVFCEMVQELLELPVLLASFTEENAEYQEWLREFSNKVQVFCSTFNDFLWMRSPVETEDFSDVGVWRRMDMDTLYDSWMEMVESGKDTRLIHKILRGRWKAFCQEEPLNGLGDC
ncbi:MAG: hypothetical protein LBU27_01760 [Candidatus Peribacteria bacterium]|jgi:hypothetical protein|nr:hypothetical protein [Candidatus Peribacteria bacterium]